MTINLTISGDTPASVTLLSLTDIYGNTPTPAPPQPFALVNGAWVYNFTPQQFVDYSYTFQITWTDGSVSGPFAGTVTAVAGYQGRYISSTDLARYLGSVNVNIQSDTNNTGQADALAIQQVISAAEDEADSILANSPTGLVVPLNFGTNPINASFQMALFQWAGADLYDKRLLSSSTKKTMPPWGQFREKAECYFKTVWYGDRYYSTAQYNAPQSAIVGAIATVNAAALPIAPNGAAYWAWPFWGNAWGCGSYFTGISCLWWW